MSQPDRERALLVCADGGKLMHAEPQDVVALLDFMEGEDGRESRAATLSTADRGATDQAKL